MARSRHGLVSITPIRTTDQAVRVQLQDELEIWLPLKCIVGSEDIKWNDLAAAKESVTVEIERWWLEKNNVTFDVPF